MIIGGVEVLIVGDFLVDDSYNEVAGVDAGDSDEHLEGFFAVDVFYTVVKHLFDFLLLLIVYELLYFVI